MIRWCSYCQGFLGEAPPFDDPRFTHGICASCDARLERGEDVREQTAPVRTLFRHIQQHARKGDQTTCAALLGEAEAAGLGKESILVGMLEPALYQAGVDWQEGRMSVAAEQRLTSWCERTFSLLEPNPERREGRVDLLILQAPGNQHTLGPRFAAQVLGARGLSVEIVVPALPLAEVVELVRELRPRFVGFSCAVPAHVAPALEHLEGLRARIEPDLVCRYALSGFAFRHGNGEAFPALPEGVEIILDLDAFHAQLAEG